MPPKIARPLPTLATRYGLPAYDPHELAAYRLANGVTAEVLAAHMGTKRQAIARWESYRYKEALEARFGDRLLFHIEKIVANREKMVGEGIAALKAIRDAR